MTDSLIVDAYEGDGRKDWTALAAALDPWRGVVLKATQGTYYNGGSWFSGNWRLVQLAGVHTNRGTNWIRGAYHYLDTRLSGGGQADYFLGWIGRAGGYNSRDLFMVDIERSGQREGTTAQQVIDCTCAFVERIRERSGKWVMLYGGSWLYELGITHRMGCKYLAIARYTETLPHAVYQRIGWDRDSLAMWQYCGVAAGGHVDAKLAEYPRSAPGCGAIDISAVVLPGGTAALGAP